MENETPHLPQEIITNILLRLPVKSLIRFQCVYKDWKNLFKNPSFIAEHLHHSTQQNPLLVVDCNISESNHWHLRLLNREMQVLDQSPHINDYLVAYLYEVYSINGLLCVELFSESQRSIWLWNPAIRKAHQVPKSLTNYEGEYFSVGFGFSSITNDYKIVKIFMSGFLIVQVEMYALRTGLWTKVELGNLEGVYINRPSVFTCNGAIFWFGMKEGAEEDRKIVSFDIAMELFTLIPFPNMTSAPEPCFNRLAMYENKLAMLSSPTVIGNSESYLMICGCWRSVQIHPGRDGIGLKYILADPIHSGIVYS